MHKIISYCRKTNMSFDNSQIKPTDVGFLLESHIYQMIWGPLPTFDLFLDPKNEQEILKNFERLQNILGKHIETKKY